MPTLNAKVIWENCLVPIARQTYPREKMKLTSQRAHCTDRTRNIAKRFGATVLDDHGKNMEQGKRLASPHITPVAGIALEKVIAAVSAMLKITPTQLK